MPDPLIVFGSGGHAKVVIEAFLTRTPGRRIIILDDCEENRGRSIFGVRVTGGREELDSIGGAAVVPAIGNNGARAALVSWLIEQGHTLETIVHPSAIVAESVQLGGGTFLSAGAIVIAEARVGRGAIINTGASVDHDCVIGEAAHIGPGVHLCGHVRLGDRTLVGVGSSILPGISVADDVILGAGSVVVRDIPDAGTYAGIPARRLR